jgi:hypothetical protein
MSDRLLGAIPRNVAEGLLTNWANLDFSHARAVAKFQKRYASTLGTLDQETLRDLQGQLRLAWDTADPRVREWLCIQLRVSFHQLCAQQEHLHRARPAGVYPGPLSFSVLQIPPITEFESAMYYFQTALANKAKHCGAATCPAPYFISTKKGQQHCSQKCAAEATRKLKREWWRVNRAKNGGSL